MDDATPDREFKGLRDRVADGPRRDDRRKLVASPAIIGQVYANPTVPAATGRFFSVRPAAIAGAEVEGQADAPTPDGGGFLVYVLGSRVPVAGDDLVCRWVDFRWVADSGPAAVGSPPVSIPGCACTSIPAVLSMISANPACAAGMFQSCTLVYGPIPPAYAALDLGSECYMSTASFLDPEGQSFRYYFNCQLTQFTLSRLYAQSTYGSPYQDIIRYSWSLNAPGNTCAPLLLANGRIYVGGDSSCDVTISA